MKKLLRFLAAVLMLVSGIWHIVLSLNASENALPLLIFGILFAIVGITLMVSERLGPYFGLLPITGICVGFFFVGVSNFDFSMSALITIDIVVVLLSAYLILSKPKVAQTT